MLHDANPDNILPPLTPCSTMRVGKMKLLPFFLPGDPAMGDAVRELAAKRSAVLLADHSPVVAGKNPWATGFAMEKQEEAAKLAILTRGMDPCHLPPNEVQAFDVDW